MFYRLIATFFMSLHTIFFKKSRLINDGFSSIMGDLLILNIVATTIPLFMFLFEKVKYSLMKGSDEEFTNDEHEYNEDESTWGNIENIKISSSNYYNMLASSSYTPISAKETLFHIWHNSDLMCAIWAKIVVSVFGLIAWHSALQFLSVQQMVGYKLLKPFVVSAFGIFLLRERMNKIYISLFLAFFASALLCQVQHFSLNSFSLKLGYILVPLFSVLCSGIGEFFVHFISRLQYINMMFVVTLIFSISSILYIILFIIIDLVQLTPQSVLMRLIKQIFSQQEGRGWLVWAGLSLGMHSVFLFQSLSKVNLTMSGLLSFAGYVWNIFFAFLILSEKPNFYAVIGAVMLIALNIFTISRYGAQYGDAKKIQK